MGLFSKKKKGISISPFDFDWGEVTPDASSMDEKEAFYVYNFSMIDEQRRDLARIFIANKTLWYEQELPKGFKHHLRLDVSGQEEIEFQVSMMREWKKVTIDKIKEKNIDIEIYMDFIM